MDASKPTVRSPVTRSDIERQAADDKSKALKTILEQWVSQMREERALRQRYAKYLLWALFLQSVAVNVVFVLIGCQILVVEEWTAKTFIMSVFAEMAAMVFVIVRYLFSKGDTGVLDLVSKL